jgi:hypothetical protein
MLCPNSWARDSSIFMKAGLEMYVCGSALAGSKNCDLNAFIAFIFVSHDSDISTTKSGFKA